MGTLKSTPPVRKENKLVRNREHLTEAEVTRVRASAAKAGRYGFRDSLMILMAYRHGFRAAELVRLTCDQIDFENRVLHVKRVKKGDPATHPLGREEISALKKLLGSRRTGPVFLSERGDRFSTRGWFRIVQRAGDLAQLGLSVHPHMLRHGAGYYLANQGVDTRAIQAYLGHRNIQHTVEYTKLASDRFNGFWKD
jgi:integrase